jgi:molybdopterin molybdotransferase
VADLLSVDAALERVLEYISRLNAETIHLTQALGRVLAADVYAQENLPPFANSSMDGFAVRAEDVKNATQIVPIRLSVSMDIPAGSTADQYLNAGECARIMTGAPMPAGADAIVPVESTDIKWVSGQNDSLPTHVQIFRNVKSGDYVRPAGEDVEAGQLVLASGIVLRAPEIGILAALGHAQITVYRRPRAAIVSTGDELVEIDQPLSPGKIRNSNSYSLAALVSTYGGEPISIPTGRDTLEDVRRCFHEALDHKADIILSSAGVSVGAFDVVRTVLDELGEINFWRINLRPGKPLAFGHIQNTPFFGLPGNPVSALVTFDVFVRPALLKLGNRPDYSPTIEAILAEDLQSDGRRSYLRVKLTRENGKFVARTTGTQSSGALTSMVMADGLLIVPEGITNASAGDIFSVRVLRDGIV